MDLEQALEGGARLGAVVVEAGAEEVAIDPDGRYPLASVRKVVTLGGFALAVASGACESTESVPLAEIERWYWPGTDGGAHQRARDWWAETGILRPGAEQIVPLREVALAMICFSDNAAADYLLHRIGGEQVMRFGLRLGLMTQDPILPALGEFRAWHRAAERWLTMSAADRARVAWEIATIEQCHLDTVAVDDATQRRCAAVGCQGTAREWARLMHNLAPGTRLPVAARRIVREALERPSTPGDDGRFGAKAGDLPGILTFAGYLRARTRGAPNVAVTMFLSGLDPQRSHWLAGGLPQTPSQLLELSRVLALVR
jgi:beta-lactamase class A